MPTWSLRKCSFACRHRHLVVGIVVQIAVVLYRLGSLPMRKAGSSFGDGQVLAVLEASQVLVRLAFIGRVSLWCRECGAKQSKNQSRKRLHVCESKKKPNEE